MQRWIVTLALLTAAAGTAVADENRGLYVGAGVGQFNVEIDDIDFDSDDTALRLFGGWRMSPNFAFELAYIDFGAPEEDVGGGIDFQVEATGFAPYLVLTAPLGVLELYTKLGYLFYDVEFSATGLGSAEESDEDFVYALGLGMVFMDHLNIRLEYEGIDISDTDDATAYWLSGAWRF